MKHLLVFLLLPIGILQQDHSKSIHPRVAASVANIRDFPSVVVIFNDGYANCGGVIINKEWILTAGFCFIGAEEDDFINTRILAGSSYLSSGGSWHYVEKTYRSKKLIPRFGGGVGVMKVSPPFYLGGDYIKRAILPSSDLVLQPKEAATIVGHGGLIESYIHQSDELRQIDLKIMENRECNKFYDGLNITVGERCFCTMVPEREDERLCLWGASDVTFKDGVVVGLRVWDQDCSGMPNIHVKVSKYVDWILKKTKSTKKKGKK